MLLEANVVGKKTDWADYITLSDEHETPMLRMLPKGPKPVNVVKNYQFDSYEKPKPTAHVDGKDWVQFKTAGAQRQQAAARVQWFDNTAAVSKLAEEAADTAGITDQLAHEIPKALTVIARNMECAASSDQLEHIDDGETGHCFRGLGEWIRATSQTTGIPVTSPYLPPAASIYTDIKGNLNEDAIQTILESMWLTTGNKSRMIGFVGGLLKKRFRDFQFYLPSSLTTQSTARVTQRSEGDSALGNTVDKYSSDWGDVELTLSRWLANEAFTGGTVTKAQWRGYFIHTVNWAWCWNQKPTVYRPEFKGGSYKAAMDAILMLLCMNPVGEGKVDPSDA